MAMGFNDCAPGTIWYGHQTAGQLVALVGSQVKEWETVNRRRYGNGEYGIDDEEEEDEVAEEEESSGTGADPESAPLGSFNRCSRRTPGHKSMCSHAQSTVNWSQKSSSKETVRLNEVGRVEIAPPVVDEEFKN
jgi:hypothetical protein